MGNSWGTVITETKLTDFDDVIIIDHVILKKILQLHVNE